jgi:cyclopropane fatty-acyl-phospholipid synthase-like methyltransferase
MKLVVVFMRVNTDEQREAESIATQREFIRNHCQPHIPGWLLSALDVQPGQRMLDMGCGTGETMLRVSSRYNTRVNGIDALPEIG